MHWIVKKMVLLPCLIIHISFISATNPYVGIWQQNDNYLYIMDSIWIQYETGDCGFVYEVGSGAYTLCGDTMHCAPGTELLSGLDCIYDKCILRRNADSLIITTPWGGISDWIESVLPIIYDADYLEEYHRSHPVDWVQFDSVRHFLRANVMDTALLVKLNEISSQLPKTSRLLEARIFEHDSLLQVIITSDVTWPVSKADLLPLFQINNRNIVLVDTQFEELFAITDEIVDITLCYKELVFCGGRRFIDICDDVFFDNKQYYINLEIRR